MPDEKQKTGEQITAEADVDGFKQALGPFVAAVEATRMPMMFMDASQGGNHPIIFVNQAFLNLTGYDEAEVLGQSFHSMMERGADPEMLAEIRTAFAGGRDLSPVVRYRHKGGATVWVSIYITPVRDGDGKVIQHFASFVDVTRHKEEEDRLCSLLERLGERSRATLATVLAITDAASGTMDDGESAAVRDSILALSKSQELLKHAGDRIFLADLVAQLQLSDGVDDRHASRINARGVAISLRTKTAVVLAVFLQQMTSSAKRHGALSDGRGTVDLSWSVDADQVRLRWQENVDSALPPERTKYGPHFIEHGLAGELGGNVRFDREATGLACELMFPLNGAGR